MVKKFYDISSCLSKLPKSSHNGFYLKSNIFQNSHRSHQIFGPLLLKDLSLKYSKIAQSGHTAKESCLTMNLPTEQL